MSVLIEHKVLQATFGTLIVWWMDTKVLHLFKVNDPIMEGKLKRTREEALFSNPLVLMHEGGNAGKITLPLQQNYISLLATVVIKTLARSGWAIPVLGGRCVCRPFSHQLLRLNELTELIGCIHQNWFTSRLDHIKTISYRETRTVFNCHSCSYQEMQLKCQMA